MYEDIKELVENMLVWLLYKLNKARLSRLDIRNNLLTIGLSKILPDDNKWHKMGITVEYRVKISRDIRKAKIDELFVYLNGKRRAKSRIHYSLA